MCYNYALQKFLTNKHTRNLWQARVFPNKDYSTIFVTICPYFEKL